MKALRLLEYGGQLVCPDPAKRCLPVTQDISLSVRGNKVECSINGSVVASYNKEAHVGVEKLKSTDGYYGLRFAHNTDVLVTVFAMAKY